MCVSLALEMEQSWTFVGAFGVCILNVFILLSFMLAPASPRKDNFLCARISLEKA